MRMPAWGSPGPLRFACDPSSPTMMKQDFANFGWGDDFGYELIEHAD